MNAPLSDSAPRPQGMYRAATRVGNIVATAGMTPRIDGVMQHHGRVGDDISLDAARAAARLAAENALRALASVVEVEDVMILRLTVYVNAVDSFTDHAQVADAASEFLMEHLGERGECVRAAVGVQSLPGSACVELDLTGWVI